MFEAGDEVVIKSTGQVGTVKILGSNYVIIEHEGGKYRKWLDDVELLEKEKEHKKNKDIQMCSMGWGYGGLKNHMFS